MEKKDIEINEIDGKITMDLDRYNFLVDKVKKQKAKLKAQKDNFNFAKKVIIVGAMSVAALTSTVSSFIMGKYISNKKNNEMKTMEQGYEKEKNSLRSQIEELEKEKEYLNQVVQALEEERKANEAGNEDEKEIQRPDEVIDVNLEKYVVQSGDTLEELTQKMYEKKIKEVLKAKGVNDVDNLAWYKLSYLVKNIARVNMAGNRIPNMNTLYANKFIYLISVDDITEETIDKICSPGALTYSIDAENLKAALLPVNENEKTSGSFKH